MSVRELRPEPLTAEAFAAFGQVLDLRGAEQIGINQGQTTRFHDLADVELNGDGAKTLVNVFRSTPVAFPFKVEIMERHPLGSQSFFPLSGARFLVLVAPPGEQVDAADLRLFITDGQQGVNFACNTWHHYQLCLDQQSDFMVIDRGGPGDNLVEVELQGEAVVPAPL